MRNNVMFITVRTPDGVFRAACDQLCAQRWLLSNTSVPGAHIVDDDPRKPTESCSHCVWCAEWVTLPTPPHQCRIHGDSCPAVDPMVTHHVARAVTELRRLTGGPLSPRGMDFVEKRANNLLGAGHHRLTADALISHMLDIKIDWLTEW